MNASSGTSSEGLSHQGVATFHELAPRLTRIEVSVDVEPGSLIEKFARGARHVKRAMRADLHRFKAYIMMNEEEDGEWRGTVEDGEVKSASLLVLQRRQRVGAQRRELRAELFEGGPLFGRAQPGVVQRAQPVLLGTVPRRAPAASGREATPRVRAPSASQERVPVLMVPVVRVFSERGGGKRRSSVPSDPCRDDVVLAGRESQPMRIEPQAR